MDERLALHYRHRVCAAIAVLPLRPSAAEIGEACEALRNTLTTGNPHQDVRGTDAGIIYEHLTL